MYIDIKNNDNWVNQQIRDYCVVNFKYLPRFEQVYYLNNINKTAEYNIEKGNKFLEDLENYNFTKDSQYKIGLCVDARLQKYPLIPDYRHAQVILSRDLADLTYLIVESGTKTTDYITSINNFLIQEKLFERSVDILSDYLESMEITIDVVNVIRKTLVNIKDKDVYKTYSKLFEKFFEEIF
jgi:hypothetical protein